MTPTLHMARVLHRQSRQPRFILAVQQTNHSETTSVAEIYKGYLENGRRYQNVREESYPVPTGMSLPYPPHEVEIDDVNWRLQTRSNGKP